MSTSTSTFAYDQTTPFAGVDAPILPEKPVKQPKAAKKVADDKKSANPALEAVPLPKLTYGRFAGVGSTFNTRMKEHFNASAEKDKIWQEAILALTAAGVNPQLSVIASVHGRKTAEGKTFYDAYKSTEAGKLILADLRNSEQNLKRVSESLINSYIKSESGGDLHARWDACRERKIITKEVYYVLKTLSQYIISFVFGQLVTFRAAELASGTKGARAIDINMETVRKFLVNPPRGSFPMSCYVMSLMRSAAAHIVEPERVTPKPASPAASSPAASSAEENDEDDEADDSINLLSMINDILGVVRKEMQDQWKERGVPAIQIRTTAALKKLFNHIIFQLCDKAIFGIHVYESGAKEGEISGPGVGVKIDAEELTGRLYQMIFDSTDSVFDTQIRLNEYAYLKQFLQVTDADYENTESYRTSCNIIELADKKTKEEKTKDPNAAEVTVDAIQKARLDKAAAAHEAELKAEAAKLGITLEAHVAAIKANKEKRAKSIADNKAKHEAEDKERQVKRKEKASENEKKWKTFQAQHEEIIKKCASVPLPPAQAIVIGGAAPAPVV